MRKALLALLIIGAALGAGAATNRTVMVAQDPLGNWVVVFPTNFWTFEAEGMMHDIAEGTFDTMMVDYLSDYYTKIQADARFRIAGGAIEGADVLIDRTSLTNAQGNTLQELIEWLDTMPYGSSGTSTTIVQNYYTTTGLVTVTASDVPVAFTPQAYSPSAANVEQHLVAIDSRLSFLHQLITGISNYVPPSATGALASVAITGPNLVYEGTSEPYTLTATMTDGGTTNVSALAIWGFTETPPAGTDWAESTLNVSTLRYDRVMTLTAQWSDRGVTKSDTHLVTLSDTNPPTLASVTIIGTNAVSEASTALYGAWAYYSDGVWENATTNAIWGFVSTPPAGTMYTNRPTGIPPEWVVQTLYAGAVATNTAIQLTASYAPLGVIGTGTQTVTIANTDQDLTLVFPYGGDYSVSAPLHIDMYTSASMHGFAHWSTIVTNVNLYGGGYSTTVRLPAQYTGASWWFAWWDTDRNTILNGVMTTQVGTNTLPRLRVDEPAAIATGQTALNGVQLTAYQSRTISFEMTDFRSGYHRQGWRSTDNNGYAARRVSVGNTGYSGTPTYATIVTNRYYLCDQDFLNAGITPPYGGYRIYVYGVRPATGQLEEPIGGEYVQ